MKAAAIVFCREELEELEKIPEITPVRREILCRTRGKLKENHISFLPFYEAVDFTEFASMQDRDLLECQLEDAGLLDALVVVQKDYTRAMKVLGEWSDKILCLENSGKVRYSKLAAAAGERGLMEMTERILSHIGEEDDCQIVLRPDGYFRHGALEGYSRPETKACYIGEAMRREKKKEQVRRKTEELQLLQQELEALEQEINGVKKREFFTTFLLYKLSNDRYNYAYVDILDFFNGKLIKWDMLLREKSIWKGILPKGYIKFTIGGRASSAKCSP